jgi:hypothetical protein
MSAPNPGEKVVIEAYEKAQLAIAPVLEASADPRAVEVFQLHWIKTIVDAAAPIIARSTRFRDRVMGEKSMADTENSGDRSNLPYCDRCDRIGCRCEEIRGEALRAALAGWLPGQVGVIAAAARRLPPPAPPFSGALGQLGPSPEEFAKDVIKALLAAADVRPPAEERRVWTDTDQQQIGCELIAEHVPPVPPIQRVFAGPYGLAHVDRGPDFQHQDSGCLCFHRASSDPAPLATHYPGDGHAVVPTHDELIERLTGRLTRHYDRWPDTAVTDPHEAAAYVVLEELRAAGGGMLRVAATEPDRCPECRCDPQECDTGEHCQVRGCPTCQDGCPLDPACGACERAAEKAERDDLFRSLVSYVDQTHAAIAHSCAGPLCATEKLLARVPADVLNRAERRALLRQMTQDSQDMGTYGGLTTGCSRCGHEHDGQPAYCAACGEPLREVRRG